jgi:hypothetical protein
MAAKEKKPRRQEIAAATLKALPKAVRDQVEVVERGSRTNLVLGDQVVASVRSNGVRVYFPVDGSEDQVKAALTHVVKLRAAQD